MTPRPVSLSLAGAPAQVIDPVCGIMVDPAIGHSLRLRGVRLDRAPGVGMA